MRYCSHVSVNELSHKSFPLFFPKLFSLHLHFVIFLLLLLMQSMKYDDMNETALNWYRWVMNEYNNFDKCLIRILNILILITEI